MPDTARKQWLAPVAAYYTAKVTQYGAQPRGVDWNGAAGQALRFAQLQKLITTSGALSLNDLGCGYGALLTYLTPHYPELTYWGVDVADAMIATARQCHAHAPRATFVVGTVPPQVADYSVASGIFNVRLTYSAEAWLAYIHDTLDVLAHTSRRGFAFNGLTAYADMDKMRPDLYYADPCALFDYCMRRYTRHVALLHDYGLYEFTILVRKE